nr:FAD-dependent thymidylate synthase [Candidatus Woesearchaeota archaeon]
MEEKEEIYQTKRIVIPEAEEVLGKEFKCLDHGFVRLIDYMGGDSSIVQAARVSYGKGTKKLSEDRGLIRYLMRHKHTTPFEMVEMKWHVKMPIFVARQWVRHRTAKINEYSLRFSEARDEFYIPKLGEVRFQSVTSRQGSEEIEVPQDIAQMVIDFISSSSRTTFSMYNVMIKNKIARELSRIGLTLNLYTEWYWKNDLHNTLHFLGLRMDKKHPQYEIRVYAEAMADIVKKVSPFAYEAFEDYVLNGMSLSSIEVDALKKIISGENLEEVIKRIENKRERLEFEGKLKRLI